MKHIFIIRHGETENNKLHKLQGRGIDASINETGKEQAEAIADALKEYPIGKIVTSSLIRTHETAEPLIKQHQAKVESYEDLDEMSFGEWEGSYFEDVKLKIHDIHEKWSSGDVEAEIEGGESPRQVFERAGNKLINIIKNSDEECIAFMLHGRLIRILLSELLGKGLKNMHLIKHQNGSINHLMWDGEKLNVVELNKVEHLAAVQVNQR